jgi:hypothetical protein
MVVYEFEDMNTKIVIHNLKFAVLAKIGRKSKARNV